ncbi:helix-turn-helix transcriptional regulator [Ahrensia sp. R2A130]|uniref:ArsR/SmtB family transcription factor n=1 Tax=Ahrensia sp. R2A130 TaxID=744979 RepID=UPI0001E09C29|nr:metalloregulator ArsR/SmtB family transcription factor [Ahrensia sp. R2A130]EFL90632.1 transcriptional regulator [Ahrensia sp. R2A130]
MPRRCNSEFDYGFDRAGEMADVFAALSNPVRIVILRHVASNANCGCKDITDVLPLAQSTVSQHLKVLIEAELVHVETVPPRSRYRVNEVLLKSLSDTTCDFLNSCCNGDRAEA